MKYKYIIRATNNHIAIPIHSYLNLNEFKQHIHSMEKKSHQASDGTYIMFDGSMLMNPTVMTAEEFVDFCPYQL